jgi:hypothetical protein
MDRAFVRIYDYASVFVFLWQTYLMFEGDYLGQKGNQPEALAKWMEALEQSRKDGTRCIEALILQRLKDPQCKVLFEQLGIFESTCSNPEIL